MADKFTGKDMELFHGSEDLSAGLRSVKISPAAEEPEYHDVTCAADTTKQEIEGLPGATQTKISASGLTLDDDTNGVFNLSLNDADTITFYPRGKTHGYPQRTIAASRLVSMPESAEYNAPIEWEAEFTSKNGVTIDTYSSA